MTRWKRAIARLAARIEGHLDGAPPRPRRIVVYRGWGGPDELIISGRVLADPPIGRSSDQDSWWHNLHASVRRLQSGEVPAARVVAAIDGDSAEAITDRDGYFRTRLRPRRLPHDREWHRVHVRVADEPGIEGEGWALVPAGSARLGLISDLDDTVVRSDIGSLFRMFRTVLLTNARTRLPFPGVARFYAALRAGVHGGDRNPLFYVSSGPWNLYEMLVEFMEHHGIPDGPLVLRDWGFTEEGFPIGGHANHKLSHLRHILTRYPELPFLLLGDSGQQDPEVYRTIALEHPGRIPAVYIRDVATSPARRAAVRALAEELRNVGTDLVVAQDTIAAAAHAAERGWIRSDAVEEVKQEVASGGRPVPTTETGR